MSGNCINCIKNRRTSLLDMLCDECRGKVPDKPAEDGKLLPEERAKRGKFVAALRTRVDTIDLILMLKAPFDDHGDTRLKQLRNHCYAAANQIGDDAMRIDKLISENRRLRTERDDQFWARDYERRNSGKEKDMARQEGYSQGWKHCKQVQDAFNEATVATSKKLEEALLKIVTVVENDNDPTWSKVQKIRGIVLSFYSAEI